MINVLISKKARDEFRAKHKPLPDLTGRVRAYQRVSGKAVGQDIARQVKMFSDFCKEYPNLTERIVYREISTSKGGYVRKKFEDMKSDARSNQFDILWVDQVSRLGRDMREGMNSVYELMETGLMIYIEQFGKIFDPRDDNDCSLIQLYFMVAEREHAWNARQTKLSMETKIERLERWGKEQGLEEVKINNPSIFDMICEDPFYDAEKSPKKLGICAVEIPHMKEMFTQYLALGYSWSGLAELFKKPVNIKCKYGCYTGKKLPFNSLPRKKGSKELGTKRTTMAEVAKFISSGGWTKYAKLDKDISKEAFTTPSGKKRAKRKCGCGCVQSEVTIARWKKIVCYDTGLMDKIRPDAFKRLDVESHEVSLDELEAMIASGSVSSS